MIIFKKLVIVGALLINMQAQSMLVTSVAKKYAAATRYQQNGIQKRTGITHIPVEKRTNIKSIADLTAHFELEIKEKTRALFDSENDYKKFMAARAKDHEVMKSYYAQSKNNSVQEWLGDEKIFPYFTEKLHIVGSQFGINSGFDVISSQHLPNSFGYSTLQEAQVADTIQNRLYTILKELDPKEYDAMMQCCIESFKKGVLLVCFGGVLRHSTFIPPVLIVSHEMNEYLKSRMEIPRMVDHLIYQYIGGFLCGHRNMAYHLGQVVSFEDKEEELKELNRLRNTIEEIICSIQDPHIARENNLYYRREGFVFTQTLQERLSMVQRFLLSELIMDCHRNDGNIKE